jgi:tetratricopeptide (TPR) repeat protein
VVRARPPCGSIGVVRTLVLVSLAVAVAEAQLVRDWRAVRSAHFELVSRYDPVKTAPLVMELEWARGVFEVNFGFKSRLDRRVLVFIPDSRFDFEQMSPSKFGGGYYIAAPWRDIIVLEDLLGGRHALFHEYTHLVLHHLGRRWPAWFNEGTAEYWATMRRTKEGVEVGAPIAGRIHTLRKATWLPAAYLFSVDAVSKLPSREVVQVFYAQSWLYIHMLHLAPTYRDSFSKFQLLIADGLPAEEALHRAYGKTVAEFDEDARSWFRRGRFPTEILQAPPEPVWNVSAEVMGDLDVEIVRTTVAAFGPTRPGAASDYARLARVAGDRCEIQAALGDLAFASGQFLQASAHYREAIRCGRNARELVQVLEAAMSYRGDCRLEELEFLVAISGSGRSHYLLARGRFFAGDYEGALRELEKASGLDQRDEFDMTRLKALSLARLGRFAEAQTAAEKLRSLARDTEQHESAQLTVDDVQRARQRSHYLLARERFFAGDYEGALRELEKASGLAQRDEFDMTRLKALSLARLGRFAEAQTAAEKLRSLARDTEQHESAQLTVDDVQRARQVAEQVPPRTALLRQLTRLDGEVIRVDCMGERARFWVRSGSETKKLIIVNPNEVVTGPDGATLEFRCGTQRRAVVIGYEARNDPTTETVGRIRYIEFR